MKKFVSFIKKLLSILGTWITVLLMVLATIVYFSIQWMFDTWSNLTMDELMYHLTAPLEGTNDGMIKEYLNVCIVPAVLMLMVAVIVFIVCRKQKKYYAFMGMGAIASVAVIIMSIYGAWNRLDVGNYVKDQGTYSTFIDNYYVDPTEVEITFPEQKRNLIYIFLESVETTYADKENGGAFEENVIPELTKLAQENEDFSGESEELNGGYAMPETTWTMGAMFAHTSGLPLSISIEGNSMDTQDTFFAGAVTIGDILEQEGYSQTLLIGSEAAFGGRELYFTEHGNYDMIDYNYALENGMIPADYRVWWGYEDQKLFGFAKEKVLELAGQNNPFNLTILTADTHFEDGYPCTLCQNDFEDDQYANVMACSSKQVDEFIRWIQQQDFYENTTIVLVGDHPTMDKDFCEDIDENYVRRVYTSYINAASVNELNEERQYTTFDSFPTTLAALGVEIEGNQLGLGTNLFSTTQTLTERFGNDREIQELKRKSKLMEELANLDESKNELLVREGKLPIANVWVDTYRYETGALPVSVTDISNVAEGVENVMLAVWTNEDQSDLQWMQMKSREDGSYYANINVPNFNYKTGEYYIHAYVVDGAGEQYMLGTAIGVVN